MKYSSVNGFLYYYDRINISWNICEPTMLFLLGLESILLYDKSNTDKITLPKYIYQVFNNTFVPLKDFNIYDDIYRYMSKFNNIEDYETYTVYNCDGIKLLINELTGTGNDRTIPIIFKNDINTPQLKLQDSMYRLSDRTSKSYFDIQAQKILDIFADATYSNSSPDYIKYRTVTKNSVTHYDATLNPPDVYSDGHVFNNDLKLNDKLYIDKLNDKQKNIHDEKVNNKLLFTYIDYKAIYSYSLGVLYGCRCLGFNKDFIWRFPPTFWYNGELVNLVNTAWAVLNFSYSVPVSHIDKNVQSEFNSIILNQLWNLNKDESLQVPFEPYEKVLVNVGTKSNNSIVTNYIYKLPQTPSDGNGKYLNTETNSWESVSQLITHTNSSSITGFIDPNSTPIIRYVGNIPITIYKPFKLQISDSINVNLAPSTNTILHREMVHEYYYISTNEIGWTYFNPESWRINNSKTNLPLPSIRPYTFDELINKDRHIKIAYDTVNHSVVSYYICTTNLISGTSPVAYRDSDLFAIFDGPVIKHKHSDITPGGDTTDSNRLYSYNSDLLFNDIMSRITFRKRYKDLSFNNPNDSTNYSIVDYFNLNKKIQMYIKNDSDPVEYLTGYDSSTSQFTTALISELGYSLTPSMELDAYYSHVSNGVYSVEQFNLRYNTTDGYWSNSWKHWKSQSEYIDLNIFIKNNVELPLYLCTSRLNSGLTIYSKHNTERKLVKNTSGKPLYYDDITHPFIDNIYNDNKDVYYIYNDKKVSPIINTNINSIGFVSLEYLYNNYGITTYLCEAILEDSNGNSLLDSNGRPLVWYDAVYNKYWDGYNTSGQWVDRLQT